MARLTPIPPWPFLTGRCQRFSNVGEHSPFARIQGRIQFGLGIRALVRRFFTRPPAKSVVTLGEASRFREGDLVRVLPEAEIRGQLDARSRSRGLEFGAQQWYSCGLTYRVSKIVRRIIDDGGRLRAVSRTVLLDGVDCGGEHGELGCGRHCPMLFRDDWLESSSAANPGVIRLPGVPESVGWVTVRSAEEIVETLDPLGRCGGLLFMPEMSRFAGVRARVLKTLDSVQELERWVPVRPSMYLLDLAPCSGAILRDDGPCDRGCRFVWHRDWLTLDEAPR